MMKIADHARILTKFCDDSVEEIIKCIMLNYLVLDGDSLLSYSIKDQSNGRAMTVLFVSGKGEKINQWINEEAKRQGCKYIYCVTRRPKSVGHKYGFKSVGTLMMREVK
jgi:hypothetical protein